MLKLNSNQMKSRLKTKIKSYKSWQMKTQYFKPRTKNYYSRYKISSYKQVMIKQRFRS